MIKAQIGATSAFGTQHCEEGYLGREDSPTDLLVGAGGEGFPKL